MRGYLTEITAYKVHHADMPLVPARRDRKWMDALPDRFANRCLPLRIANEAGWWLLCSDSFQATWTGGQHQACLEINSLDGKSELYVGSHFSGGILTFSIPYLFRTPPGYNLLVRGPANMPKAGASPLEGVVESDWSPYTFTMNWQITRVDEPVMFKKGEPICQIVPQRRGELESFHTELQGIEDNPHLRERYEAWSQGRTDFLNSLYSGDPETTKQGWQKDYFQGREIVDHQTKLGLSHFKED